MADSGEERRRWLVIFCLFKHFTHSETTLILVCGMLAVRDCRAVWRTDGLSKKPAQKHSQLWQYSFFPPFSQLWNSYFLSQVTDHCTGETADICFKRLFDFLYFQYNMVNIEDNKLKTPYLFSNQGTQEKKTEPHSQSKHTYGSLFPLVS